MISSIKLVFIGILKSSALTFSLSLDDIFLFLPYLTGAQGTTKTKTDILQNVNPVTDDIQISKIKHVKDGGILIGCKTAEDNLKLKSMVQEKLVEAYDVREVGGVNPRIRIVGMTREYSSDQLRFQLLKMNIELIVNQNECKVIKIMPFKRDNQKFQVIVQVDKASYEKILKAGNVFIGLDSCKIFDAVQVSRCFNCNGFNHSSKFCKKERSCPRCGENHAVKDCKSVTLKCVNCCIRNVKLSRMLVLIMLQACNKLREDILSVQ
nr:unnamed protein product [Callosobruchus analis]